MIHIYQNVLEAIIRQLSYVPAERGGILGAKVGEPISAFYYDSTGYGTKNSYSPDCEAINNILENEWFPQDIYMIGVIHSHDTMETFPSCTDLLYAEKIYRAIGMNEEFYFPIFNKGKRCIYWFTMGTRKSKSIYIKEEHDIIVIT